MKRVFIDTNILIDYILEREYGQDAKQLLQRGFDGEVKLFSSYLTFANMAYILGKKIDIYELFGDLNQFITVLPMDEDQFQAALKQPVSDFEDMLQYQCAMAGNCDIIITNNKKDFESYSVLPISTAADFMKSM